MSLRDYISSGLHQLAFFSEEESNTSDEEEVDSNDGQESDHDYADIDAEQLERTTSAGMVPHHPVLLLCLSSAFAYFPLPHRSSAHFPFLLLHYSFSKSWLCFLNSICYLRISLEVEAKLHIVVLLCSGVVGAGSTVQRVHNAPLSMRWALRQPSASNTSGPPSRQTGGGSTAAGTAAAASNPATSSGLIYIDPVNLRRTNTGSLNGALTTVVQSAAAAAVASNQIQEEVNSFSTSCTVNNLSRSFGIILRQVWVSYCNRYACMQSSIYSIVL